MDARELAVSADYLVALQEGDDWREAIEHAAGTEAIEAGWFTGLGTVRDADLWHYDPTADEHRTVRFDEPLSVAACVGTVTTDAGEPFARPHAVLSRPSGQALGGYLNAATVVEGTVHLRAFADATAFEPTDVHSEP